MADAYKFDVAISILSRDEALAIDLHDSLSQYLSVFVYSKRQEDLAGTDGLDSFRAAFRFESRLTVVLYRDGWGETPWTRVEETAIKERVLADGWDSLFFISLERSSVPPKWLPKTYIRFSFEDYGMEQAAGAVKARIQEIGGSLRHLDVLAQAQIVQRRTAFFAERERLLISYEGGQAFREVVVATFAHVERKMEEINASAGTNARVGIARNECVVTNGRVSVVMSWRPRAINRLEDSPLVVQEFNAPVLLPGERGYYFPQPPKIGESRYQPEYSASRVWCCVPEGKSREELSAEQLGDMCVLAFLRLLDMVASGKLQPPTRPR
jgi:hypothetical protein